MNKKIDKSFKKTKAFGKTKKYFQKKDKSFNGALNIIKNKRGKFLLLNNIPKNIFTERLFREGKTEYRIWDPKRSKLAAYLSFKDLPFKLKDNDIMLYLGASHGYTISFLSEVLKNGLIYGVDLAERTTRELIYLCKYVKNVAPIYESANHVDVLAERISQVDVVFQDIAQKDQDGIFLKNIEKFLKKGGYGILCLKTKSVDVRLSSKKVFENVLKQLKKEVEIIDSIDISKFEIGHYVIVVKKK